MGEPRAHDRRSGSAARRREILAEDAPEHYNISLEMAGGAVQITEGALPASHLAAVGHRGCVPDYTSTLMGILTGLGGAPAREEWGRNARGSDG